MRRKCSASPTESVTGGRTRSTLLSMHPPNDSSQSTGRKSKDERRTGIVSPRWIADIGHRGDKNHAQKQTTNIGTRGHRQDRPPSHRTFDRTRNPGPPRLALRGTTIRLGQSIHLAAALRDIESVYVSYYPDLAFPGAADTVQSFIDAAVKKRRPPPRTAIRPQRRRSLGR